MNTLKSNSFIEVNIYFTTIFSTIQNFRTSYSFVEIIDLLVYVYQDSFNKNVTFKKICINLKY